MSDSDNSAALSFSRWRQLAEELNLLLSPESYDHLEKDKEYLMVQVDYMGFLYEEARKKYKHTKVYSPQELYTDLKHTIAPTKVIKTETDQVLKPCDNCNGIQEKEETVTEYCIKSKTIGWNFYTVGNYKWLATGNGDGWTRWMLWDDLKKMPNVYYKKSKRESESQDK